MKFGNRLKTLRLSKDMTQEELGRLLGKTKNSISQYETGKREPDLETLMIISEYFNVTLDYLLGKTDDINYGELDHAVAEMVGSKISILRRTRGTSASVFEDKFLNNGYSVSDVENGDVALGINTIIEIARYFDVPVGYLTGAIENPISANPTTPDHSLPIFDWPEFLAQLPEDQAMHYQDVEYSDEEKLVIMEEAEKAKQKKLKKIEKFMQYPVEVIDDALIYAAFDAEQRKKMNDEN